jgi:hypothetical protein
MVTLDQCREILKNGAVHYSDEQIIKLRDFLYTLASIDYQLFLQLKGHEKSNPVYARVHR